MKHNAANEATGHWNDTDPVLLDRAFLGSDDGAFPTRSRPIMDRFVAWTRTALDH